MPDKYRTPYESWEQYHAGMPIRSQVYHLKPVGGGTSETESLTSYIARLARAHNLSVRDVLIKLVFHNYGHEYLLHHSLHRFWTESSRALNGASDSARDMVRALEILTLRTDLSALTMLTWVNVLPARGLLRMNRAWCPECFAASKATEQVEYDPLIWALEVVSICPRHERLLCHRCPACQEQLPWLASNGRPGYCSVCECWLGIMAKDDDYQTSLSDEEWEYQSWVVKVVGEMIAKAPTLTTMPSRTQVAINLEVFLEHVGGSNSELARLVGVSKYTIRDCRRGEQLLQLATILRLCHWARVSPFDFLTAEMIMVMPAEPINAPRQLLKKSFRKVDKDQLRRDLIAESQRTEEPPLSMRDVASRLGYDLSYLTRLLPDECQLIKERYQAYIAARQQQLYKQLHEELRQSVAKLRAEGIYPSQKRVAAMFSRPWFMRLDEAREAWRVLLQGVDSHETA